VKTALGLESFRGRPLWGVALKRFVEGRDRRQGVLLPEYLDDYVSEENPVRVVEAFIDELDLAALGFAGVVPEPTGRPAYHPRRCRRFTSTAISTACSRAGRSNGKRSAISS